MSSQTGQPVPALEPADSDNELEFLAEYRPPPPSEFIYTSADQAGSSSIPEVNVAEAFSKQQQQQQKQTAKKPAEPVAAKETASPADSENKRGGSAADDEEVWRTASQDLVEHYNGLKSSGDSGSEDGEDSVIDDPMSDWSDSESSRVQVTTASSNGGVRVATGVAVRALNGRQQHSEPESNRKQAEQLKLHEKEKEKQRIEKERQEKEKERQRLEKEKQEKEKEKQRLEKERQEKEKQRLETERREKERQRQEKERQEKERQEKERQKQEKERLEKMRSERERQAKENEKKAAAAALESQKQQQPKADQSNAASTGGKKKKKASKAQSPDQNANQSKQADKANPGKQTAAAEAKAPAQLKNTKIHEEETEAFRQSLLETSWQTVPAGGKKGGGSGGGAPSSQSSAAEPLKLISDEDFPFLAKWQLYLACCDCAKLADGRQFEYEIEYRQQRHQCARNILFARNPGDSLWRRIRIRDGHSGYHGNYYRCYKSQNQFPCREQCTFGHSDIETEMWNLDKDQTVGFTVSGFIAKHNGSADVAKQLSAQQSASAASSVKPLMSESPYRDSQSPTKPSLFAARPTVPIGDLPPIGALYNYWSTSQMSKSPADTPPASQSASEQPQPLHRAPLAAKSSYSASSSASFSANATAFAPVSASASASASSSAPIAASVSASASTTASSSYYPSHRSGQTLTADISEFAFDLACSNCVDENGNRAAAPCETCPRDRLIARLINETTWFVIRLPTDVETGYSYVYELCSNQATFGECFHGDECDNPHSDVECKLWNLHARGVMSIEYIVNQLKVNTAAPSPQKKPPAPVAAAASAAASGQASKFGLGVSEPSDYYGYGTEAVYDPLSRTVAKEESVHGNEPVGEQEFPLDSTHQFRVCCLQCVAELPREHGFAFHTLDNRHSQSPCQLDRLFVCQRDKQSEGWKLIRPLADHVTQEFTSLCRNYVRKLRCSFGLGCRYPHCQEEMYLWNLQCSGQFHVAQFVEQFSRSLQAADDNDAPAIEAASFAGNATGQANYLNSLDDFNDEPPPQSALYSAASAAPSASASASGHLASQSASQSALTPDSAAALPTSQPGQGAVRKPHNYLNSLDDFDEPAPVLRPIGQRFEPPVPPAAIVSPLMDSAVSGVGIGAFASVLQSSRPAGAPAATATPVSEYPMALACEQCSTPLDVICTRFKYHPAAGHSCAETRLLVRPPGSPQWCQVRPIRPGGKPVREYYNCRLYVEDKCLRSDCDFAHGEVECQLWNLERAGRWSWESAVRRLRKSTVSSAAATSAATAATFTKASAAAPAVSGASLASKQQQSSPLEQQQNQLLKAVCFKCRSPRDPAKPSQCLQKQHAWVKPIIVYSSSGLEARAPVSNPAKQKAAPIKFFLCQNIARTKNCTYGAKCVFPHSPEEERLWNLMIQAKETDVEKYYEKYCAPGRRL